MTDMVKALKGKTIHPKIRVEDGGDVHFAVNCRHCTEAICVKSCISGALSIADGAVLAAVNIADQYFKEVEAAENLRRQLKEYLEEATKMKLELSEAKREIFKLQNKK